MDKNLLYDLFVIIRLVQLKTYPDYKSPIALYQRKFGLK